MAQSKLLVHPAADAADGVGHRITPAIQRGCARPRTLNKARSQARDWREEVCIVVLGQARDRGRLRSWNNRRAGNVFDGLPWSVYLPRIAPRPSAASDAAVWSAPASGSSRRVIKPGDVGTLTRGTGSNARQSAMFSPDAEAESVLVW